MQHNTVRLSRSLVNKIMLQILVEIFITIDVMLILSQIIPAFMLGCLISGSLSTVSCLSADLHGKPKNKSITRT